VFAVIVRDVAAQREQTTPYGDEPAARRHVARVLTDALIGGWQVTPTGPDAWALTHGSARVELRLTRSPAG
jgi:hypothetical protein